ncbi:MULTISPECIES: DUF6252 family protein [Rufibacter]|uniref:DUF5025 domain-containing protein n=1 Tax=Rufibacter quisquiliarum TaxID=1549639 RepID=A0A839GPH9_9BACT|nr:MULTISPECIES: DUF6252 family protein [Rufibacter]MBA9079893.1 hypothetical protein [Rufibacter quisquiliarum]
MKRFYLIPVLLFLILVLCSCTEEDLPKPTQSGANMIACKVNGKPWISEIKSLFVNGEKFSVTSGYYEKPNRYFVLWARRVNDDENSSIQLAIEDLKSTGRQTFEVNSNLYPGNYPTKNYGYYQNRDNRMDTKNYVTNTNYKGSINVTRFDTINYIVSGTFEFTAENLDGSGETVKISDGRFDVKYR